MVYKIGECHNANGTECRDCLNYYTDPHELGCDLPEKFASLNSIMDLEQAGKFAKNKKVPRENKKLVFDRLIELALIGVGDKTYRAFLDALSD
jgi:hypothetical protein